MADTTFVSGTVITSEWLNEANEHVWNGKSYDGISRINVKDPTYGVVGDGVTDDTAAMQAAFNSGKDLYIPPGTYVLDPIVTPGNITITGAGRGLCKFKQKADGAVWASKGIIYADSLGAGSTLDNITIQGITFEGRSVEDGFSEFIHLVSLNGVRNVVIQDCAFVASKGDGIYLGSGIVGGVTERHNYDVKIVDCFFDGVNNENRNAITVLDCVGLVIRGNSFKRYTKTNMPGAIDIEPDQTWNLVRNITISENHFDLCGGGVGLIACIMAGNIPPPKNLSIVDNVFTNTLGGAHTAAEMTLYTNRALTEADDSMHITIRGNKGRHGFKPFVLWAVKGVTVSENDFDSYDSNAYLGYLASTERLVDAKIVNNRFVRCGNGTASKVGVSVLNASRIHLNSNIFDDCGDGTGGSYALEFNAGTSDHIKFRDNIWRSPTGKTEKGIAAWHSTHVFNPYANAQYSDSFFNNLANEFHISCVEGNNAAITWTPAVAGSTTAGTYGYAYREGYWRREGNVIFFECLLIWNTMSGSTGSLQMSLPAIAAARTGNPTTPIGECMIEGNFGGFTPGNKIITPFLQDQAITDGNLGSVRFALWDGNAGAQALQPATVGTIWCRGSYAARIDVFDK